MRNFIYKQDVRSVGQLLKPIDEFSESQYIDTQGERDTNYEHG